MQSPKNTNRLSLEIKTLSAQDAKSRLLGLDHLRALAITFVFLYHYSVLFPHPEWIDAVGKFGWTGVDLFFVLSGYLISSHLFAEIMRTNKISFRAFFLKRFFRIIPAYLVVLALYFLFPPLRERAAIAPLWKFLTFTQNLGLDLPSQGAFSHAWSLCIEEQFYLCLPVLLVALAYFKAIRKGFILLLLIFILGFAMRLFSWNAWVVPFTGSDAFGIYWYKWIYYPTYCRLDGLLSGVLVAAIFQFKPEWRETTRLYGNYSLLAGLAVLAAAYLLCLDQETFGASIFGFPMVALGYGFIVLGAISPTSVLYRWNSRTTTHIATLSYAVYLTHKIIIRTSQELFSRLNIDKAGTMMFVICLAASLIGAFLLNRIIEKPFLKLKQRYWGKTLN